MKFPCNLFFTTCSSNMLWKCFSSIFAVVVDVDANTHSHSYANSTLLDCSISFVATLPYSHHIESYFTSGCVYTFSDGFVPILLRFFCWISQKIQSRLRDDDSGAVSSLELICAQLFLILPFFRATLTFGDDLAWQKLKYSAFNINQEKNSIVKVTAGRHEKCSNMSMMSISMELKRAHKWAGEKCQQKNGSERQLLECKRENRKKKLRENWFYSHRGVCNKRTNVTSPKTQISSPKFRWVNETYMKRQWELIDMKYVTETVVRANWSTQAVA